MNLTNKYNNSKEVIEEFLEWCDLKIYPNKDESYINQELTGIKNFIEKMASWYELSHLIKNKQGKQLYSYQNFLEILSPKERAYISNPTYSKIFLSKNCQNGRIYFTKEGIVESASEMYIADGGYTKDISPELLGLPIEKAVEKLDQFNLDKDASELANRVIEYYIFEEFKEKLLDCVMYQIMDKTDPRKSSYYGLLFAEEFKRDIKKAATYATDHGGLTRAFLKEYLAYCNSKGLSDAKDIIIATEFNHAKSGYEIMTIGEYSSILKQEEAEKIVRKLLEQQKPMEQQSTSSEISAKQIINYPLESEEPTIINPFTKKNNKKDQICKSIEDSSKLVVPKKLTRSLSHKQTKED